MGSWSILKFKSFGAKPRSKRKQAKYLIKAIRCGDTATLQNMLNRGFDCSGRYEQTTPLNEACANGEFGMVSLLLRANAPVDTADEETGNTPLLLVVDSAPFGIVDELLRRGASVNVRNHNGQTPLLKAAFRAHHPSTLAGVGLAQVPTIYDDDIERSRSGIVPIIDDADTAAASVAAGSPTLIVKALLEKGSELEARNHDGYTPLHVAAWQGHTSVVDLLIQHGADLNATSHQMQTPLHLATSKGNNAICEMLLLAGADVNCRDDDGRTPLVLAAQAGNGFLVQRLVDHICVDMELRDHSFGLTALGFAIVNRHFKIARMLLDAECSVRTRDYAGNSPVQLAAKLSNVRLVKLLLERGADPREQFDGVPVLEAAKSRAALRKDINKKAKEEVLTLDRRKSSTHYASLDVTPIRRSSQSTRRVSVHTNNTNKSNPNTTTKPHATISVNSNCYNSSNENDNSGNAKFIEHWTVQDVCDWLELLSLDQFVSHFKDAAVNGDMLVECYRAELTAASPQDSLLQSELCVARRIHRLKLCKEIAKLLEKSPRYRTRMSAHDISSPSSSSGMVLGPKTPALMSSHSRDDLMSQGVPTPRRIELREITIEHEIGRGAFGVVHKARWRGTDVAVKMLHQDRFEREDDMRSFLREAELMELLGNHPSIVNFCGVCVEPPHLALVTEWLPGGSVKDMIERPAGSDPGRDAGALNLHTVLQMAISAAAGVLHLHAEGVIHRDLAARNLLVDHRDLSSVRVTDFGISRLKLKAEQVAHTESNVGPVMWMAPESIERQQYSEKSDSFSFGVCLWEMLHRATPPYPDLYNLEAAIKVVHDDMRPRISPDLPPALADLLRDCWQKNPQRRPTFEQITTRLRMYLQHLDSTTANGRVGA